MTNAELITTLRWCGGEDERHEMCVDETYRCPMWNEDRITDECKAELMTAAADALEAADKRIAELNTKCADLQSQINSMENEIEELIPKDGEWLDEQRGRWIYAKCNLCGKVQDVRSNYCPNCGAKMIGEQHEQESK